MQLLSLDVYKRQAYKGSVADMVFQMIGGIRSGMGYVGAATIQDLHEHAPVSYTHL